MSNYLRPKYILSEYSSFGSKQYVASQIELDKKFEKHLETLDREKRKEISKDLKVKTIEAGIRYAYSDFEGIGIDHLEMDKKIKYFFNVGYQIGNRRIYINGLSLGESGLTLHESTFGFENHHAFKKGYNYAREELVKVQKKVMK